MSLRILFVTPYVPSIVRTRPYSLIRGLAKSGHKVTLVCLLQPEWEKAYLEEVTPFCEAVIPVHLGAYEPFINVITSLFSPQPLSVAYCRSALFKQTVKKLAEQKSFDLLHTEFIRAAPATLAIKDIPKLFDAVDSLALSYRRSLTAAYIAPKQRLVSLIEWLKMRTYEPWIISQYDRSIVCSPIDQRYLQPANKTVEVIPNGVDLDYFKYDSRPRQASTLIFLGKMSYYVNVASILWFYREIFPKVKCQHPEATLKIVGRNPVPAITRLGADPAVEVTGTVPDVRAYLANADVSILPMVCGGGMQIKMLESMAVGTPCVATQIANLPLRTVPGRDVLVADSPDEFASAICSLFDDPAKQRELSENGRRYVEEYHNWHNLAEKLGGVYAEML